VAQLYAGTSGFSYTTWRPGFYPPRTRPGDFLRFYAERLPAVEVNTSFYQLPSEEHLERWAEQAPAPFRFAVKMTRRITHSGRVELVSTFCERVRTLGERLGPVLVQLPETRPRDDGWLRLFLDSVDPELDYAFEFRHDSWADAELGRHPRVGSLEGAAPFRYLRLREPPYEEEDLTRWAARLTPLVEQGVDVYAFFKHEDAPDAPRYAQRLLELAGAGRS
jgi:uncharacterized protein YecE (DUF72 family)